jgi:hypothetical protein
MAARASGFLYVLRCLIGWPMMIGGVGFLLIGCCSGLAGGCMWMETARKPPRPAPVLSSGAATAEGRALNRTFSRYNQALTNVEQTHQLAGPVAVGAGVGILVIGLLVFLWGRVLVDRRAGRVKLLTVNGVGLLVVGGLVVLVIVAGSSSAAAARPRFDELPAKAMEYRCARLWPAISPDERWLAINEVGAIIILDQTGAGKTFKLSGFERTPEWLAFVGNRYLVSGHVIQGMSTELMAWDLETRQCVARRPWSGALVQFAACSERNLVAIGTNRNEFVLFTVPALEGKGQVAGLDQSVHSGGLAFFPGGKQLATCNTKGSVSIYSVDEVGNLLPRLSSPDLGGTLAPLAVHPGGKYLAVGQSSKNRVLLLNADNLKEVRPFESWGRALAFSPDGKELAIGAAIYDVESGKHQQSLSDGLGHDLMVSGGVSAVAYFPSGRKIAVGRGYSSNLIVQDPLTPPPGFGVLNIHERR